MQDWLSARADATPHKTALLTHTFQQLNQQVSAMSSQWRVKGIQRGDHVGLIMQSSPFAVVQVFTALRTGAVLVPLNSRLTVDEIHQQLTNADCKWLLSHGAGEVLRELHKRGHQIIELDETTVRTTEKSECDVDLDAPFLIVHTSGTSGVPKGATLTAGNIFYSATASAYRLGVLPDDKWLCTLPLYHVGGLSIILRACLYGITVDLRERFDLETVNHALAHEGVTLVSLVPTMLYRLLEHGTPEKWSSLRCVLLGGAAATADLLERCAAYNIPVATTYGLSEAASQVATASPELAARKPGTVGKPLLFTRVRVVDENDDDQPVGEYGEVVVSGPTVMQEYYNHADATAKTLRDGWLHTGDIGYLDEDGDLWLVQRRSDLIVTGGENVYPAEVEAVLRSHPAVKDVAVVGVSDPEWGQQVAAAVQRIDGAALTEEDLIAYSRERLAGYKHPRRILFVAALPQTGSGKIQRRAVVDLFGDDV